MNGFTMEIAGLATAVQPLFTSTREYCRAFLTESESEFFVEVTKDDLVREQQLLDQEAVEEGLRLRSFTDPFLERSAIQRKIGRQLLSRNTVLLHGSTVGVDGGAYLFTAPCGTGKSTHTRFWREIFGPRAVMVNDDKAFLRITDAGVLAFGSPWTGKHGLGTNISLPLKGICFLRRGEANVIGQAKPEDCLGALAHQCFIPEDACGQALALIEQLAQMVPLWEMACTKDRSAALISYEAMSAL